MKLSDFDYDLPPEYIAQHPLEQRDHSRLMVIDRESRTIEHLHFYDLTDYVNTGDTLVFNNSRVIPARLKGTIASSQRQAEILLLKQLTPDTWEALVRPGRKLFPGARVLLTDDQFAAITERREAGIRVVKFSDPEGLDGLGEMPLPPYIKAKLQDRERYQTVYSSVKGSAAAPTAGLHFTPELMDKLRNKGVNLAFVTLHIGLDTFQPVRAEDPSHHKIHTEFGLVDEETALLLIRTRKAGKRVIAVGTTSVRLIEAASQAGEALPFCGQVGLFILPGYRFMTTDAIITNFHLPRSTLLMMLSAFAGREFLLNCYEEARETGYRFYSFGDAMLVK
ncbi:MAG: tRNA preQ1(34) S-adenosylmethionine ribosyltransferase-isomerase QueA [Dehalococcoidia bacterium]|jgi:S-adenosylmethionine:tRNA ribosyltransferase-isomerase